MAIMTIQTWDQKIARAQKLAKREFPAQELLNLYIKVANFQKQISASLDGADHADIRCLLQFLPPMKMLLSALGSEELQAAAAGLGEDSERWSDLLLKYWEQDPQEQDTALAFLAYLLLQPYAQHVTSRMNLSSPNTTAHCPACGNPPQLSLLREFNTGAKRSLVCALCSSEWEFRRVLCPSCGEQHKDKLPVFTTAEFEQARIEACDACKTYIKCIDLSKDGYAIPPVDDLATVALDLWAADQGYTRQHPNMFLMTLPESPQLP